MRLSLPLPVLDPRRRWAEHVEPIVEIAERVSHLSHGIDPDTMRRWGKLRSRRRLKQDAAFRGSREDLDATLGGFDWDVGNVVSPSDRPVRALLWNIERGKRFEALRGVLNAQDKVGELDLLFLCEVDWGMGRSGNRHVARELASELGLGYVFAPSHLLLAPGDVGELEHLTENTEALHGVALLSRYPIRRICGVPLPEYVDKFKALEKRLGHKRALVAEVELPSGLTTVAVVHLDPFSPPRHRARQLRMVLRVVERFGNERTLIGGDLNTTTYDFGSAAGLAVNIAHKLVRHGVQGTIRQYMWPDQTYERRLFSVLRGAGFEVEGFTDPTLGTIYYDLNDPEQVDKTRDYLSPRMLGVLMKSLEPWDGCVPLRLDWFAGRGLRATSSHVIDRPLHEGKRVADHNPMVLEFLG